MLTLNVHEKVKSDEDLAALENDVLGKYQASGEILRTTSVPRTNDRKAEHFAAVLFDRDALVEVGFARFWLGGGAGRDLVYSKRFYGADAKPEAGRWLQQSGASLENALMRWSALPSDAQLRALPESR
jgi:hypothetical protein